MPTPHKRLLAFATFTALCVVPSASWCFNEKAPFDISADRIDYLRDEELLVAEGRVVVVQASATLRADFVTFSRKEQSLFARGSVILEERGSVVKADELNYDLAKEEGQISKGIGQSAQYSVEASTWSRKGDYFIGQDGRFTSCDLPEPHYYIRSSRLTLKPKSYFWAWNNRAYVGGIPVFYTPFVYKNLEKRRIVFQMRPGHDQVNGGFLRTITTLRFTDNVYDRVYIDHYSKQGEGIGNELNYYVPNKVKGSLFGYYIDPKGDPTLAGAPSVPQYNIRFFHWQRLNDTFLFQANTNLRNNISFNNQYFPQDNNQSVTDINSSIALTHQKSKWTQRILLERLDTPDAGDTSLFARTHLQRASVPRYEVSAYQRPLWSPKAGWAGPLLVNGEGSLTHSYARVTDAFQTRGAGQTTVSQTYQLGSRWTFTPSLAPELRWQDKSDPPPIISSTSTAISRVNSGLFRGFQGRWTTQGVLRYKVSDFATLDQTYQLINRFEPNKAEMERSSVDRGIEAHRLNWLLFARPSRDWLFRSFAGFDFRTLRNEPFDEYQSRKWQPWTSELTWQARRNLELFGRYQLGFYPTRTSLWETSAKWRGPFRTILESGFLYNKGQPHVLTWNQRVALYVSSAWRVDVTAHSFVPASEGTTLKKSRLYNTQFSVVRDLHCWELRFSYRNQPPLAREYSVFLDLKVGKKAAESMANKEVESQFYPWRATSE